MSGAVMKISDKPGKFPDYRPDDYGVENALAKIVRREFRGSKLIEAVADEFGLEPGQARGVVHATASKGTLNTILRNAKENIELAVIWIEASLDVCGLTLEDIIEHQATGAKREREQAEERERYLAGLDARWRAHVSNDGGPPR